jgi:aminoglycoside phosphotransferase (APT) family kinase protein
VAPPRDDAPVQPTLEPLPGGWSGETFLAQSAGERSVVRVYGERSAWRGPAAPEVDAAVLALVRGLVPVPEVLEVRRADLDLGAPGLLITELVAGVRGDLLLPTLDDGGLAHLGAGLGRVAGMLACMPMPRAGTFVDGTLALGSFGAEADLGGLLESRADRLEGWTAAETAGLRAVARDAQDLLDGVPRRALVHGDLNPKNVLLEPDTLAVAAVLDWEFAHAGHPATDLGNLLRFERHPRYVTGVLGAYCDRVPGSGAEHDLLDLARAADLAALITLAARRGENPVADRAHERLLVIARSGDVHAS